MVTDYRRLFGCEGKVAMVFGGMGLIGKEVVMALSQSGAIVCSVDIKIHSHSKDSGIFYYKADLTREDNVIKTINDIVIEHGKVHIFVNCSYPRSSDWGEKFEHVSYQSLQKNLEWQLGLCLLSCRGIAEHMKKNGEGTIVNFGSTYGVVGPDFSIYEETEMTMPAAYSAIKGGIINFTRYLATYYGKYGIRANCISPGGVFDHQNSSFVQKYSQRTPLGRMGKPEEIAAAVVFLASDASSYMTGHNMIVDGGWTAW